MFTLKTQNFKKHMTSIGMFYAEFGKFHTYKCLPHNSEAQ